MVKVIFNSLGPNTTYHCMTTKGTCKDGDVVELTVEEAQLVQSLRFAVPYNSTTEQKVKGSVEKAEKKRKRILEKAQYNQEKEE